jgi:hypothetical protein
MLNDVPKDKVQIQIVRHYCGNKIVHYLLSRSNDVEAITPNLFKDLKGDGEADRAVFKTSLFLPSQRNMFPASLMSKWLW